eukprot:1268161-Rhodomonas_salina.1
MKRHRPGEGEEEIELDPFHRPRNAGYEKPYLLQDNLKVASCPLSSAFAVRLSPLTKGGFAVMMQWEKPLMEAHAGLPPFLLTEVPFVMAILTFTVTMQSGFAPREEGFL